MAICLTLGDIQSREKLFLTVEEWRAISTLAGQEDPQKNDKFSRYQALEFAKSIRQGIDRLASECTKPHIAKTVAEKANLDKAIKVAELCEKAVGVQVNNHPDR